jgi:hypothetical protein
MLSTRAVSYVYLIAIPFLTAILGFGVGHISYQVYIPVWLVNVVLMALSAWTLGLQTWRSQDAGRRNLARIGVVMIVPWALFSIFFGMGPPPVNLATWLETATEQQTRYYILVAGGIIAGCGFALLAVHLAKVGETFYGVIGRTLVAVAIPLFVLNMIFWGQFLLESFRGFTDTASAERPAWYVALRSLFYHIALIEVALLYLTTVAFAAGLDAARIFKTTACRIYIAVSIAFTVLSLLPTGISEPFATLSYIVSVPAIPFIMPYLMGVNLLRRAGSATITL